MRKKALGFIVFFLSLSIYFSCIDEGVDVPGGYQKAPETELLAYAKKLVGENGDGCSLINLQKGNPNSRAVTDYSTAATPLWEKAKTERNGDEEILIVPLQSEQDIHSSMYFEEEHKDRLYKAQTFSRLVIRKKNGETYSQVFTYLPSRNYAKNRQEVLDTMGFSPLAVKYYGTILISGLDGKFQQGFFYEGGVPIIHFTKHRHSDSAPVLIFNDSTATEECHEHSHANSFFIRLNLSGNPSVASRSYEEGDEDILADYCPACGSTDPEHSCTIVDGSHLLCPECKKLKENCVCLPTITRCPVCDMYYCECFEPCPDCYSYPCVCGGNGSNDGNGNNGGNGDNLGGGSAGGGYGVGGGDGSDAGSSDTEPLSCKNLEEVLRYIPPRLAKKGISLNNYNIVEDADCSAEYASVNFANNWIQVCAEHFYGKPIEDQTSIVYHEYFHLTNDVVRRDSWNSYFKYPDDALRFDTPPETIMAIYRNMYRDDYEWEKSIGMINYASLDDYILDVYNVRNRILPPERYQQECAAYLAEKSMFPLGTVSVEYYEERELKLWEYQQLYKCSINNYFKL